MSSFTPLPRRTIPIRASLVTFVAAMLCGQSLAQYGPPPGGGTPIQRTSPAAGLPRPWECGLEATPYNVVNLYNGNLLTEIGLIELGTMGPLVRITLFHNSAAAEGEPIESPAGFSLGAGWSLRYGGAVIDNGDDTVTILEDDGNQYTFELVGTTYVPPTGVHDWLVWDDVEELWMLTRPDQVRRVFDAEGRLLRVYDAAGAYLLVERDNSNDHRITEIVSAAEVAELATEHVAFTYDANGLLESLTDPNSCEWTFEYDCDVRLSKINFPNCGAAVSWLEFEYDELARIEVLSDSLGNEWAFTYHTDEDLEGMLATVTGPPADPNEPNAPPTLQELDYSDRLLNNHWKTWYTDWEQGEWVFWFDTSGRFVKRIDPTSGLLLITYDSDNNATSLADGDTDPIEAVWGPGGTLETLLTPTRASDAPNAPAWNEVIFLYDQPDPTGAPNFWRLGQTIDEDGYSTEFLYDDLDDPARLTEMIQQAPGGDPNSVDVSSNPFPVTGWGTHERTYWRHAPLDHIGWPISRAFESSEPTVRPGGGGGVDTTTTTYPTQWRWRFSWVVAPFGAHVGIDYYLIHDGLRYLDYGEPPNVKSECPCCLVAFGAHFRGVNNRHPREGADRLDRLAHGQDPPQHKRCAYGQWYDEPSGCVRGCFNDKFHLNSFGVPPNWTDSSDECCRYHWSGWTPSGWGPGNWSNSNGGIHAAYHLCMSKCGRAPGPQHPPSFWSHFTPGYNNKNLVQRRESCPGYKTELD